MTADVQLTFIYRTLVMSLYFGGNNNLTFQKEPNESGGDESDNDDEVESPS